MELYASLQLAHEIINNPKYIKREKICELKVLGFSWHEAAGLVGYKNNSVANASGRTGRPIER